MATAPVTVTANLNFNPASINAAGKQVQSAFGNINLPTKAVNNFNNSLGRITGQASEFDKSINAATARVFAFGAAVSIINGISTAFKALVSSTIEVEKRLTEISSILGGSVQQLNQFKTAIFDVAKNTGQTFATVADGASELARQGLSAEETVKRLNAALILTRVSGLDAEGSVNALTSAINGFTSAGLTAEQIVNKLIAVDTAFAVSAKDLAEAFSRAGSTAEDAGVSFDELLGLVTSVQQTTARGGAVIGNAFKSIFSRLSRGTVIDDLQALGVEINASQTGVQKLQALSQALSKISDPTQANAIKELAGGVYQINVVSAALKDLSSETSIFGQASQTASKASNEAFEKNAQLNQTLASQINKLVQGLTELGSKIGELTIAPVIENLLTGANKLLDILNKVFDPEEGNKLIQGFFKGVGAFIAGPGLVLVSAAFFKLFQVVAKFAKEGISDLFKIGSEQERIKNIEGGIVALLQQDAKLRATLLSSSTSQAQKEQAVINSIKQQNALLAQQQALVNSIAVASAKAGVGGFSPSGGFTKKKGKGMFAAGYSGGVSPQEAAMEMAAANQHGYKAGKVKKERIFDGSGSSFMGILNSAESRKDFINGSGYKSTLITPPNGFAARGFVPNFASKPKKPADPFGRLTKEEIEDKINEIENNPNLTNATKEERKKQYVLSLQLKKERLEKEQDEDGLPKLGSKNRPLPIQAQRYAMLIPNLNYGYNPNQDFGGGSIDKWKNIKNLNYRLTPTQLAGPNTNLKITEQKEASIAKEAMDNIISTAVSYSKKLSNPLMKGQIDETTIATRLGQKGGNKGAYGAVQGAAGAAFEAVITQGLGIDAQKPEGGDWDAKFVSEDLQKLFGITQKVTSADFKVSTSESSIESYAKKILNDKEDYYKKQLGIAEKEEGANKPPTKRARRRGAASGFIPNFADTKKPWFSSQAGFKEFGKEILRSVPEDLAETLFTAADPEKTITETFNQTLKEVELAKSLGFEQYDLLLGDRLRAYGEKFIYDPEGAADLIAGFALKGLTSKAPGLRDIEGDDALSNAKLGASAISDPGYELTKESFGDKMVDAQVSSVGKDRLLAPLLRESRKGDSDFEKFKASAYQKLINIDFIRNSSFGKSLIDNYKESLANEKYFDILSRFDTEKEEEGDRAYIEEYKKKYNASGYLPNFTAINDAISREMAAGVPKDKIYIDQDNSLKSPSNPEGLLVANRDDEPNGGKQGIRRAISEGKNPKTYGSNLAAKGFVPNYARSDLLTKLLPKLFNKIGKSADDAAGKLDDLGDAVKKEGIFKRGAKAVAQEGVTTAKVAAYSAVFGSLTFSLDGLKGAFNDLVEFFNDSSDAIKEETSLRNSFVNQLQKEKAKDNPNESRVKDLEGLVAGSEAQIKNLEEGTKNVGAATFKVADYLFSLGDTITAFGGGKLLEKTIGKEAASEYTDKTEFEQNMGAVNGVLTTALTLFGGKRGAAAAATANFVGKEGGELLGNLVYQSGDSGAGGQYYSKGLFTDEKDKGKSWNDPTIDMRNNDVIGEFINRGYSFNEQMRSGEGRLDYTRKDNESTFLANLFEDKKSNLESQKVRTENELVEAKKRFPLEDPTERVQQLTSKLEKIDSQIENLDFKSFLNNFIKGVDARMAGESPLAKAIREAGGEGLNNRKYAKATEENIEYIQLQGRINFEAEEIRKEIDRVKELFEKETVSFKFDVKNVRSQLERIIDDVSIEGSKASFERSGNITELQKRASNYQFGAFKNDSSLSVADQRYMAREAGSNNLKLDEKQFTRQDKLIQQKSADTFGDLFTKLTGNLNSSGSGTALLERERAMSDLSAAQGALAASTPENRESAQQRVYQLSEKLSQIDSNIASRKDTAADSSVAGEIQRDRLQRIQGAANTLTTGSKEEQQYALEDIFRDLENLNLEGGGAEIKEEILDAAKEVSAERTAIFIDQEKTRLTNQLDVLEKEKSILDQFISDFNSSFAENIKGTRDNFNTLTKNQRPVTQNAAALTGARIGQGETTNTQIISDRLNAANRVTQTFDGANFSNLVGQEDLATFRSNTASQIVSGGKLTALEDINEKVAGNLRNTIDKAEFNDQETSSIKQVAKGSLEGISSDILNRATGKDPELAARAQELQDVLSDPEAGISQILTAVEGLNIDSSVLSEEIQTALQEKIAIALGTIGGQTRSVEGAGAVNESKDVSAQINDFSQYLSNLNAALDENIPEVKFPEIVAKLETNTDLLQTAIGSLTSKFDSLDQASKGLEESLGTFKKTVDSFTGKEDKDKEKLKAMADALDAVREATKNLKSDNSEPK
jgi:TP901 family phage tail tape measure protein